MSVCTECYEPNGITQGQSVRLVRRKDCQNKGNEKTPCKNRQGRVNAVFMYCDNCSRAYNICQRCGQPFTADRPIARPT